MKKNLTAVLAALLMMCLTVSAFAATGVGHHTTVTVTAAAADKAGSVAVDTYFCAVTLDDNGVITGVQFDCVQSKGSFDAAGAVSGEVTVNPQSKNELADAYGMKAYSPIGKEFHEQMDALAAWCVGKTLEEVLALNAEDADLKAGCTVYIGSEMIALQKAVANAK